MRKTIAMGLFAALLLANQAAFGQGDAKVEAKGHFEAGLALFKAEKYDAAALELEASVKLYPTKGGLFNLASVYKVMSRYDDALAAISRLDKEYEGKLDAEMRDVLAKIKTEITTLAARLEVTVEPMGAAVTIDGRKVGKSPLARPVLVDPGEHAVRATLAGYAAAESIVQVISRQTEKVRLVLKREAGAVLAPVAAVGAEELVSKPVEEPAAEPTAESGPEAPTVEEKSGSVGEADGKKPLQPVWFWAGLSATVAFAGVTLGLELAVRSNKDDIANTNDLDKNERMQKAGIAFLGLTAAAAVTTAVLAGFTEFGKEEETPVVVGVAPNGVAILGRF